MLGIAPLGRLALGQIGAPPGVAAEGVSYAVTGIAASLSASLLGAGGSFSLYGQDAGLVYERGINFSAGSAAFSLVGAAAGLDVSLRADAGAFAAGGIDASARFIFPASVGAFTASGASGLKRGLVLHAEPTQAVRTANFVLFSALGGRALGEGAQETPAATTFSLEGQNNAFAIAKLLTASAASFVFTGQAAALTYAGYPPRIRVFPSVGRGARGVSRGSEPIRVFASTGHGVRRRAFGG